MEKSDCFVSLLKAQSPEHNLLFKLGSPLEIRICWLFDLAQSKVWTVCECGEWSRDGGTVLKPRASLKQWQTTGNILTT